MELQEFRKQFSKLKLATESWDDFQNDLLFFLIFNQPQLPLFPENNLVHEDWVDDTYLFDGKTYQRDCQFYEFTEQEELFVDPLLCIGTTWLYNNDRSYGRPLPERMVISLSLPATGAPPVPAARMGDRYVCNDGNHRIYAAYLLGEKVKIRVEGIHELIN